MDALDAGPDQEPVVTTEAFTVNLGKHRVARDGRDIRLTPTEWKMLEVLVRNPEKSVPALTGTRPDPRGLAGPAGPGTRRC